ncbi:MAG: DUF2304 domain-containing protein [bacterium]|nr:DUF2304 domain-containing protein [bacterium]
MIFEELSLVSLLTPLFSLLMILRSFSLYSRRKQTWRELLLWLVIWLGIGLVALFPQLLDSLPAFIGIKSGVNVLIFFGMVLLFYGFFRLMIKVEELEEKVVNMNRERALDAPGRRQH